MPYLRQIGNEHIACVSPTDKLPYKLQCTINFGFETTSFSIGIFGEVHVGADVCEFLPV